MQNLNKVSKIVYTITFLTLFVEFFFPNFGNYVKRTESIYYDSLLLLVIVVLEFYKRNGFSIHSFRILYFVFFAVSFFIKIILEINLYMLNISVVIFTIVILVTERSIKKK